MNRQWSESDQTLINRVRGGDRDAFGELWLRHHRAAHWVAREFTSIDPDDLVSQAYLAILETIQRGGGPSGPFRPYLYMVVRNLARRWGSRDREITVDEFTQLVDDTPSPDETARNVEYAMVAKAFSHLPERWQSVLWYTEVEGLKPREVAPLLGISENSVSALAYRAREGLRQQWVQSHVSTSGGEGECSWALGRLGEYLQAGLGKRDAKRMLAHLSDCEHCRTAGAEAKQLSSQLAYSMIPLLLGGAVGSAWLSTFGAGATAASAASFGSTGIGAGAGAAAGSVKLAGGSIAGTAAALSLPGAVTAGITAIGAAGLIAVLVAPALLAGDDGSAAGNGAEVIVGTTTEQDAGDGTPPTAPPINGPDPADTAVVDENGLLTGLIDDLTGTLVDDTLTPITDGIGNGLNGVADGVGNGVDDILGGVGDGLDDILDGVGSGTIGGVVDGVGNGVGSVVDGVGDGVGSVLDGVGDGVGGILDGIGNGLGNLFGKKK